MNSYVTSYLIIVLAFGVFGARMYFLAKQQAKEARNAPLFGGDPVLQQNYAESIDRARKSRLLALAYLGAASLAAIGLMIIY